MALRLLAIAVDVGEGPSFAVARADEMREAEPAQADGDGHRDRPLERPPPRERALDEPLAERQSRGERCGEQDSAEAAARGSQPRESPCGEGGRGPGDDKYGDRGDHEPLGEGVSRAVHAETLTPQIADVEAAALGATVLRSSTLGPMRSPVPLSIAFAFLSMACGGAPEPLPSHPRGEAEQADLHVPPPQCPPTDAPAIALPFRQLPFGGRCVRAGAEGATIVRSADALLPCPQQEAVRKAVDFEKEDIIVFTHWDSGGGGPDDLLVAMVQDGDLLTAVYNEKSSCGGARPSEGTVLPKETVKRARTVLCPDDPCDGDAPNRP